MAEFDIPPSNIDLMQDTILRGGIAFPNRYSVSVVLPPALINPNNTEQRQLNIRCENAAIVGRAFSTLQYRFYGPARNIPYESIYSGEIQISFLLSGYLQEREYFETWMNKVCNKDDYKFRYFRIFLDFQKVSKSQNENWILVLETFENLKNSCD